MRWPAFITRRQPAPPAPPSPAAGLRKFDTFTPAEVRALPKRLRKEVEEDRKRLRTADLQRHVARLDALGGEVA